MILCNSDQQTGSGSLVVFDYVRASVLRHENTLYGESEISRSVLKTGEPWRFGIEPGEIESFATAQGFEVSDHKCAQELQANYFQDMNSKMIISREL